MNKYEKVSIPAVSALVAVLSLLFLAACGPDTPALTASPGTPSPGSPATPSATATHFQPPTTNTAEPPTATPEPLALLVNGVAVSLDDFNAALQRFHAGIPDASSEEAVERVTQDFVDQILLAQGAAEQGFVVDEALLQSRLADLIDLAGGESAFDQWRVENFYTPGRFANELERAIAAAWMRDEIAEAVPRAAEQVRARQVRLTTRSEAGSVLAQLNAGASFALLAESYDPLGLGELGWFPRGYLLEPAIEEAAFGLEVGQYSAVIETRAGFHIVLVTDRSADRELDPDALWTLQVQALRDWIAARQAAVSIETYIQ